MLRLLPFLFLLTLSTRARAQGTPLGEGGTTAAITLVNCERVNTAGNDFGPMPYRNGLVYVTRPRRGNLNPTTGLNYYELFLASVNPDGLPGRGRRFSTELNGGYNEGPVSFANEERVIYFTRTQLRSGVPITDRSGRANLGIFSAYRARYDWDAIRALPFNGPEFSNQHPTVTPDGKRIFFSSNRPGGFGGYDLYFSDYRDGRWEPAINLGAEINSEGNEAFPYIHPDGTLYFASNGHGGRGGFDVLRIDLSQRRWGPLLHLPAPINGPADDLGFVLRPNGQGGYLVSNRPGGQGGDDIYLFQLENGLADLETQQRETRTMVLSDASTSRRLVGASVWLAEVGPAGELPAEFASLQLPPPRAPGGPPALLTWTNRPAGEIGRPPIRSAADGTLDLELTEGQTYEVTVLHPNFQPERFRFLFRDGRTSRPLDLSLQPRACTLVSGRVLYAGEEGEALGAVAGARVSVQVGGCRQSVVSVPPGTTTDGSGYYELCLPRECDYELRVSRPNQAPTTVAPQPLRAAELTGGLVTNRTLNLYAAPQPVDALSGGVLSLPGLTFVGPGGSGTTLAPASETGLAQLSELRRQFPGRTLTLIAHDDGPLPSQDLQERSAQRLRSVLNALNRRGVVTSNIQQLALDNSYRLRPCSDGCTEEDYAVNRRVEVRVE